MTFTFHTILKIFKIISAMYWFPEFFSFVVAGFFLSLILQVVSYLGNLETQTYWPTRGLFNLQYPQTGSLYLDMIRVF